MMKKRSWVRAGIAVLVLAMVGNAGVQMAGFWRTAQQGAAGEECGSGVMQTAAVAGEEDIVIRQGKPESGRVAITCNVDWGEDVLPAMLATLKEEDVKITFFVSGKWAKKNPELLRKMYVAGHEIQSHGYGHKLCSKISKDEAKEEILKTETAIRELLGEKTTVFAPPSGDYNADTVALCRELGYKLSLWSADTIDWWPGSTAAIIQARVLKKDLNGGIILMHPKPETSKALSSLIRELKKKNLSIVPLAELGVY